MKLALLGTGMIVISYNGSRTNSGGFKMKLALLGTGMIVTEVLPVLQEIDGIELAAILSTPRSIEKAQHLAEQYQIPQATSNYEDILANPQVDTIYVGTPNHTHYTYAKQALLAGKHVICEKRWKTCYL